MYGRGGVRLIKAFYRLYCVCVRHAPRSPTHISSYNTRLKCFLFLISFSQREREAREARQLDREIRAQERHLQAESKKKEAAELHKQHQADKQSHVHTEPSQIQKGTSSERTSTASTPPTRSPRESIERVIIADGKSRHSSIDKDKLDKDKLGASSGPTTSSCGKQSTVKVSA